MQSNIYPSYSETIPFGVLSYKEFLEITQQALDSLGWHTVSVLDNVFMAHTPSSGEHFGESISITVFSDNALFVSKSTNEYYFDESVNENNAQLFKQALKQCYQANKSMDQKLKWLDTSNFGALVPSKHCLITPLLIYANWIVYLLMVFSSSSVFDFSTDLLHAWGGALQYDVLHGSVWQWVTYMFLHGGLSHIVANTFALLYVGQFLEPMLGRSRFLLVYLLAGIAAGITSSIYNPFSVAVGASGPIFGLYGTFLALLSTRLITRTVRRTLLRVLLLFVVYNLLGGLQSETIDNAAHIGGMLAGMVLGIFMFVDIAKVHKLVYYLLIYLLMISMVALYGFTTIHNLEDKSTKWARAMDRISTLGDLALEPLQHEKDNSENTDELVDEYINRGNYYWNECIKEVNTLYPIRGIPQSRVEVLDKMKKYYFVRIRSYNIRVKMLKSSEDDYAAYEKKYEKCIEEIDYLSAQLNGDFD